MSNNQQKEEVLNAKLAYYTDPLAVEGCKEAARFQQEFEENPVEFIMFGFFILTLIIVIFIVCQ